MDSCIVEDVSRLYHLSDKHIAIVVALVSAPLVYGHYSPRTWPVKLLTVLFRFRVGQYIFSNYMLKNVHM